MPQFTRKETTVEARQHLGANLPVTSSLKGDQICHTGDFLVVDPDAVAALRQREKDENLPANSLPNKGTIYVIAKADFLKEFNGTDESVVPIAVPEQGFDVATDPLVEEPVKTEPAA